jgi:hypothetical protein
MFTLCGRGAQCSIDEGQPSAARMDLLRREALELSLYTFKYDRDAESTIVFLPPNLGEAKDDPADDTAIALFLRKKDFARELSMPVRNTLFSARPPAIGEIDRAEQQIVNRLTDQSMFQYQWGQAQTGGALLLLAPVNART